MSTPIPVSSQQPKADPLIVTFLIGSEAQAYFNSLRQKYFPPDRNYIDAHLTLFHALPDQPWIMQDLEKLVNEQDVFEAKATSIVSLGYGTAFKIMANELNAIHQQLQKRWLDHLTNQDRQKRNFHITVQNKVQAARAKHLQQHLTEEFEPFSFKVIGIQVWRYLGGPWEHVVEFHFQSHQTAS